MSEPSEWFVGEDGRTEDERVFMAAVRDLAASAEWGLQPSDTWSTSLGVPLYLSATIPALRDFPGFRAARDLEIALWPRDSARGLRLDGMWGNSAYPMDDIWPLDGSLLVVGVDPGPRDLAAWTVQWLVEQLRRPVRHRAWAGGGRSVQTADTDEVVGTFGGPWRRIGAPVADYTLPASAPIGGVPTETEAAAPISSPSVTTFVGVSGETGRGVLEGTGPYEFFTDDGARVFLHDADLVDVLWQPDASLRFRFVHDPEWTPPEAAATPVVELEFFGSRVLRWASADGAPPEARGQVSAFDWDGRDRFDLWTATLGLSFTADRMVARLLPHLP